MPPGTVNWPEPAHAHCDQWASEDVSLTLTEM
jgi:hypothetical protein